MPGFVFASSRISEFTAFPTIVRGWFASISGLSLGTATPATIGNCKVYVDLGLPVVWLPVRTNATGAWSLSGLVPDNRALIGIALGCQGLLASAAPLGFDLTNGLRVTAGY